MPGHHLAPELARVQENELAGAAGSRRPKSALHSGNNPTRCGGVIAASAAHSASTDMPASHNMPSTSLWGSVQKNICPQRNGLGRPPSHFSKKTNTRTVPHTPSLSPGWFVPMPPPPHQPPARLALPPKAPTDAAQQAAPTQQTAPAAAPW